MSIIAQNPQNVQSVTKAISAFMYRFGIVKLLSKCNAYKEKGISVAQLFTFMLQLVFQDRSMYMQMKTGRWSQDFSKNTYYRFLNSVKINWERFTTLLAAKVITMEVDALSKHEKVFVVDDSLYNRVGFKRTELCAKVFDHTTMRYTKGFRALTLGWTDGHTFIPVLHRLLSSPNDANLVGPAPLFDKRTLAGRRRAQARRKGTEVMIEMISAAVKAGINASYVLFDSWFSAPKQLKALKTMGLNSIAMIKISSKIHYVYKGETLDVKQIYSRNKKRCGRSRYLLSVDVTLPDDSGEGTPAKIVCVRNRANRKDWLALISTDTSISEEEIIRLYGKRWDIEVFFKTCKSYLKLLSECHSLSYDALTAHTSIVFTRYIILSLEQRIATDERTLGDLFLVMVDELKDITFSHSFELIMAAMLDSIREIFCATDDQISRLMETFMAKVPEQFRALLRSDNDSCTQGA